MLFFIHLQCSGFSRVCSSNCISTTFDVRCFIFYTSHKIRLKATYILIREKQYFVKSSVAISGSKLIFCFTSNIAQLKKKQKSTVHWLNFLHTRDPFPMFRIANCVIWVAVNFAAVGSSFDQYIKTEISKWLIWS